jgi:hypothetical protein
MKTIYKTAGLYFKICIFASLLGLTNFTYSQSSYNAYEAPANPVIDGIGSEPIWTAATWKAIDQTWLGTVPSASDFQGKYKVCWKGTTIFILAEIVDNVLYDGHSNPLVQWYDDDCIEIFIDEDNSNGNHQCTYNAFAYHVATNGDAVDLGLDCNPHLYNSHIVSSRTVSGTTYTWEIAMTIYNSSYSDAGSNTPVALFNGKVSGFSLAYCDNDGSATRENFMGSEVMPAGHNNDNYITADYFGNLNLLGPNPTLGIHETEVSAHSSNGQIELDLFENSADYTVSILDLSGKCFVTNTFHGTQYLSDLKFAPGVYIIRIETEKRYLTKKVVVY